MYDICTLLAAISRAGTRKEALSFNLETQYRLSSAQLSRIQFISHDMMAYCAFHLSLLLLLPFIESSWDSIRFYQANKAISEEIIFYCIQASKVHQTRELWHWNQCKLGNTSRWRSCQAQFQSELKIRLYSFPQQEHEHQGTGNQQWGWHQTNVGQKQPRSGFKHALRFDKNHKKSLEATLVQNYYPPTDRPSDWQDWSVEILA